MRIATAFTEKALKEVHPSELKDFSAHFPCELHSRGYAENNSRLWSLKSDPQGGWREDYLKFESKKTAKMPIKSESKMEEKERINNRVIIDIYPISRAFNGGLVSRPAPRTHEVAVNIAATRSRDFEKDKNALLQKARLTPMTRPTKTMRKSLFSIGAVQI